MKISFTLVVFLGCLALTSCSGSKTTPNEEVQADAGSGIQAEKVLEEGTCSNGSKDSGEADVDCGGSCVAKCEPYKTCTSNADCLTSFSQGGKTYSDIRCDITVAGFDPNKPITLEKRMCVNEQLVWDAAKVAVGPGTAGSSTAGPESTSTTPVAPPTVAAVVSNDNDNNTSNNDLCSNSQKDSGETDVDCGGNCSAKCPPFKLCASSADCMTSFSQDGKTYSDIRCDDTVASFDPNAPVDLEKKMCVNEQLFWTAIQVAISQGAIESGGNSATGVKYLAMREGKPSLSWESTYTQIHCPDDAQIYEGSNDTRGSVMIPNFDLAHTEFACVVKFSEAYPRAPTCVITGIGLASPVEMTFKIHSVTAQFVEVKGQVNGGSGGVLSFNYICLN